MSELEKRFYSGQRKTIIAPGDPKAKEICQVLSKALGKSNWIARGGMSSNYYFNFDKIYNQVSDKRG